MASSKETVKDGAAKADPVFSAFCETFAPLERPETLLRLIDQRTGARYCECHIKASKLVEFATTDAPLDLDEPDYRANRELVTNAPAFAIMKADAAGRRSFSNIVAEYSTESDPAHPLKIIGGQHRIEAIREAFKSDVDEHHGVKVYFDLNMDQRLDVQLISNTNIAISGDLFDRMQETVMGPQLRDWCQSIGLLPPDTDFADRRVRGGAISVQMARTFITNYFEGKKLDHKKFEATETTPILCQTGQIDAAWEKLRTASPDLWKDDGLRRAATQFAALTKAQRAAFAASKPKPKPDYPEKAMNPAVLAAWAYVAGALHLNAERLKRHYALAAATGRDPLNAAALADGRHKTDPDNYRGLGYRTDAKERGRLVELFNFQAENGIGITKPAIEAAIAQYHAKQAALEAQKARAKASGG
jgi:hypothetical protein